MSADRLPSEIDIRARRHRRRLDHGGIELESAELDPERLAAAAELLVVDVAPETQPDLERWLGTLRRITGDRAVVRMVEETAALGRPSIVGRFRARRAATDGNRPTDRRVVEAAWEAGWTVIALERFRTPDGRTWVDLALCDTPAAVSNERAVPSDERDGDQWSEQPDDQ